MNGSNDALRMLLLNCSHTKSFVVVFVIIVDAASSCCIVAVSKPGILMNSSNISCIDEKNMPLSIYLRYINITTALRMEAQIYMQYVKTQACMYFKQPLHSFFLYLFASAAAMNGEPMNRIMKHMDNSVLPTPMNISMYMMLQIAPSSVP